MLINEILSLKMEKESIKKIDKFLSTIDPSIIEWHQATCYKALILNEIDKTNEALKLLISKEEKFSELDSNVVVCYADTLKRIFMSINQYDLALKYINIKEKYLSFLAHDEYYKDLIIYNKAIGNDTEVKKYLLLYLEDDISEANRAFAYELLIDYQFHDTDFNSFYDSYDFLYNYYKETLEEDKINHIDFYKAKMLILESRDDEAIIFINSLLERISNPSLKLTLYSLLINIYVKKEEYRKAMIQDANSSLLVDDADKKSKILYYEAIKDLYERTKNHYSLDLAIKALNSLKKDDDIVEEVKETKKKEYKKRISDPIIIEKVVKEDNVAPTLFNTVSNPVNVSKLYEEINPIIKILIDTNESLKLREILRQAFIELEKISKFNEALILFKSKYNFTGMHYKKGRLYDKTFNNESILKESLAYKSLVSNEIIIKNSENSAQNISLIREDEEEYRGIISIPLIFEDEVYSSITFYGDINICDEFNYEIISVVSNIINLRINYSKYQEKILQKNDALNYLTEKISSGILINYNGLIKLNNKAIDIFKVADSSLEEDLFLSLIDSTSRIKYHSTLTEFLKGTIKECSLEYKLVDNRWIREEMFLKSLTDSYEIVSFVKDITEEIKEKERLLKIAYNDSLTGLASLLELKKEVSRLNNDKKYSFTMINTNHFKLYKDVYGLKFSLDLLKAISKSLKKILPKYNGQAYHFDNDKFVIILPINDERTTKRQVLNILDELKDLLFEINHRLKLTFKAGICLVQYSTSKTDYDSLIEKTSLTLDCLEMEDIHENTAMYYKEEDTKEVFYNFQMELHISEAIDNRKLRLSYRQIIDIKNKKLFAYEAFINLTDTLIEQEQLESLVKKRHLEEMVDKYLINQAIIELKDFYSRHGSYFKVFVKIHASTLSNKSFLNFLEEKYKFYKIPRTLFSIEVINDGNYDITNVCRAIKSEKIMIGSSSLDSVIKDKLTIYFCNNKDFEAKELYNISELCQKMDIELILNNIDTKEDLKFYEMEGYRLLKGNAINKRYTIEEIIDMLKN